MTIVDTADLEDRTCRMCGAVAWDRIGHQRWHREEEERYAKALEAVERARDIAVRLWDELDGARHD